MKLILINQLDYMTTNLVKEIFTQKLSLDLI